jgi:hypothetical protein
MARFPHLVFDITNKLTGIPEGPALEVFESGFSDLVQQSLRVICNQLFIDALQAVDESLPSDLVSPIVVGIHQKGKKLKDKFAVDELLDELIENEQRLITRNRLSVSESDDAIDITRLEPQLNGANSLLPL